MNFTIQELNEIYYALGVSLYRGQFVDEKVHASATEKMIKEMERVNNLSNQEVDVPKATPIAELQEEITPTKVITPITDTGSEVADFLIAATAAIPEATEEKPVKKSNFPGAKKSNLMEEEK